MTIYEDDRISVTVHASNHARVTVSDKYGGGSMSMNKAAFEEMCRQVAEKLKEKQ